MSKKGEAMNILHSLTLSLSSSVQSYTKSRQNSLHETISPTEKETLIKPIAGIQVSLSDKGLEKLAEEKQTLGEKIKETLTPKDSEKVKDKAERENDALDKIIDNIKEKIKEVKKELQSLQNDKSENAQKTRKLLNSQLTTLNGALMSMIGKKLELTKS